MAEEKFILTLDGGSFEFKQQGTGDMEAAKSALSAAFGGLPVSGYTIEDVDLSGK